MTLPGFTPEPLRVTCDGCGASALTRDGSAPDAAVKCGCCPADHDHMGDVCDRTVTITASAYLHGTASG